MYNFRKKRAPGSRMELSPIIKEIKKRNKGSDDVRLRSHSDKFSTCEKEVKKILKHCVVIHTFNATLRRQRLADL